MAPFYLKVKEIVEPVVLGPGIFWLLFIIVACTGKSRSLQKREVALKVGFWGLFLIVLLTAPPFLEIFAYPLYSSIPVRKMEGAGAIVVLGGGVKDSGLPSFSSYERVYDGVQLFFEKKAPLLLLSTGHTNKRSVRSEAEAMGLVARSLGVSEDRIIYENSSYNTFSNAVETKKILDEKGIPKIILVTSRSHMYRAYSVFDAIGVQTVPALKKDEGMFSFAPGWGRVRTIASLAHEYIAIIMYSLMGRV